MVSRAADQAAGRWRAAGRAPGSAGALPQAHPRRVVLVGQQAGAGVDGQARAQRLLLAVHHVRGAVHLARAGTGGQAGGEGGRNVVCASTLQCACTEVVEAGADTPHTTPHASSRRARSGPQARSRATHLDQQAAVVELAHHGVHGATAQVQAQALRAAPHRLDAVLDAWRGRR